MEVTEIWRYRVKTMAGEKLQRVGIGPLGIEGDRVVHVEDAQERVITSRSHPRFMCHRGTLGLDGTSLVDGRPWNSPEVAAEVVDIVGRGAKLVRYDGIERFDVLPLLVATDGTIAAFGHDHRRLRPNIVLGGQGEHDAKCDNTIQRELNLERRTRMFERRRLACTFCHRPETEVGKLVAGPRILFVGPRVHICDRCVEIASEIMKQDHSNKALNRDPRHGFIQRVSERIAQVWRKSGTRISQRQATVH